MNHMISKLAVTAATWTTRAMVQTTRWRSTSIVAFGNDPLIASIRSHASTSVGFQHKIGLGFAGIRQFSGSRSPWMTSSKQGSSSVSVPEGEQREVDDPNDISHHKLAMIYTCKQCTTRSSKTFSKIAYTRGVVIIRCPKCKTLHLVADHLGYFDDKSQTVESILAQKDEKVITRSFGEGDIELVRKYALEESEDTPFSADKKL